jgi:D-alanine transaminase/branched-chain amino acid aminotransferase
MINPFGWSMVNGKLLDSQSACLQLNDLGLQRSFAVFDFFMVKNEIPLYLEAHLQRLHYSANYLGLEKPYTINIWREMTMQLIEANTMVNGCIKILVTGGYSEDGYTFSIPNCIITAQPIPSKNEAHYEKGISLITYPYRREMAKVKTTNYAMGMWLQPLLHAQGVNDVLYCYQDMVHETPRSNLFIVDNHGILKTPDADVLHGVTRANVLQIAASEMAVAETEVYEWELASAKEVFITSTTKGIVPVTKINDRLIGTGLPGPITTHLQKKLAKMEAAIISTASL